MPASTDTTRSRPTASVSRSDGAQSIWVRNDQSFSEQLQSAVEPGYARASVMKCLELYQQGIQLLEGWCRETLQTRVVPVRDMRWFVGKLFDQIIIDIDLFVAIAVTSNAGRYPYRHQLQATMLALACGTRYGLPVDDLMDLALGCLIHDIGMLIISDGVCDTSDILDQMQFLEVKRHPTAIYDLIQTQSDLSSPAKLVVYQMHERMNGTGYPRKRKGEQISVLSQIAAVCDVYVALISPRPHRPAVNPYRAVERVVDSTRQGEFASAAVRAFMSAVSLFPVGSKVRSSDGRVGRVLRAHVSDFGRPLVELHPEADPAAKEVVDLSQKQDVTLEPFE